jgi:hypothetical protein
MRNAAPLDHIFHGRFLTQTAFDRFGAHLAIKKKNKVAMELEPNCEWDHVTAQFLRQSRRTQM